MNVVKGPLEPAPVVGALGEALNYLPKSLPDTMSASAIGDAKHIQITLKTGTPEQDAEFVACMEEMLESIKIIKAAIENLPSGPVNIDASGRVLHEGTRRAVCFNNDVYWNHSKRIVENMATALGQHPQLIAWQIDSGIGGNQTPWVAGRFVFARFCTVAELSASRTGPRISTPIADCS